MSEKPIIYNGEMVRTILAEPPRKSQTRRVIKYSDGGRPTHPDDIEDGWPVAYFAARDEYDFLPCSYGQPGDRLWVKETHAIEDDRVVYRADLGARYFDDPVLFWLSSEYQPDRWRPSIHMPRWASRITLEITGIRVERVQDITEADVMAEGCESWDDSTNGYTLYSFGADHTVRAPSLAFASLWNSLNAKRGYGWDVNPWVWVIEFRRIEP